MEEIEVHKTLTHPSIVKYLTHFSDGNLLIVLELADLGTLEKLILEKVTFNFHFAQCSRPTVANE